MFVDKQLINFSFSYIVILLLHSMPTWKKTKTTFKETHPCKKNFLFVW